MTFTEPTAEPGTYRAAAHSSNPLPDRTSQIRAWLAVIDALLVAVEQTAWQARHVGARARDAARGMESSFGRLLAEGRAWFDEVSILPAKAARLGNAGLVLTQIAASYRLHLTQAAFLSEAAAAHKLERLHAANARRFYELSVRHGGAFLKVGQMLSARPDLLPAVWVEQLELLQDAAPALPFAVVKQTLERELGERMASAFASIDEQPLAAASIGQVHRARLHDGRHVAVKVQRPGLTELMALDLELLSLCLTGLKEQLPPLDLDTISAEVRAMVLAELDYELEAESTGKVRAHFREHPFIEVPEVIRELSTSRVLVTSFEVGDKITRALDRLAADDGAGAGTQLSSALTTVLEAYAGQVLELGLFQADPHPGNLLLRDDGVLVLLDFGCAKELTAQGQRALIAMAMALVTRNEEALAVGLKELGFVTRSGTLEGLRRYAALTLDEARRIREHGGEWPDQADALAQLLRFSRQIEADPLVHLPVEMVMLGRVFGTLAGLFLHYRPDLARTAAVLPALLARLSRREAVTPGAAPAML